MEETTDKRDEIKGRRAHTLGPTVRVTLVPPLIGVTGVKATHRSKLCTRIPFPACKSIKEIF